MKPTRYAAPILWLDEPVPLTRRSKCLLVGVCSDSPRLIAEYFPREPAPYRPVQGGVRPA